MSDRAVLWRPNSGPQTKFLRSPAFEALYGGAAGGGKSDALLMEATRQIGNPEYRAILFRRTFPELQQSGGLIDRSKALYPALRGEYSETQHRWQFPSGAQIGFAHMQREDDKFSYQGAALAYIGFDELTHFTETQYLYLFSRCRAAEGTGLRCYVRATTNPGGHGHEWVKRRWGPWLDRDSEVKARAGDLLYYAMKDDADALVGPEHPDARSRTFIGARVSDNPFLAGTDYERNLKALPLVERKRLLEGDWDIMPGAGLIFKRQWFDPIIPVAPAGWRAARYWDLAATAKEATGNDPDYTVGLKMSTDDKGLYCIEHVVRVRERWDVVKTLMRQQAEIDGRQVIIGVEQEPGASGKALMVEIIRYLAGFAVRAYPATGDKLTRALPLAAQAEAHNVRMVAGEWNQALLDEYVLFPDGTHDDQVDGGSGAFNMLSEPRGVFMRML